MSYIKRKDFYMAWDVSIYIINDLQSLALSKADYLETGFVNKFRKMLPVDTDKRYHFCRIVIWSFVLNRCILQPKFGLSPFNLLIVV